MYSIQILKEKKKTLGLTNRQISELSGIPLGTVQKIFSGETETPRYQTVLEIDKAIADFAAQLISNAPKDSSFRESVSTYNAHSQHLYTVEDYLALPDDRGQRYELIDGVLYDMGAPTVKHQVIGGFIYHKLCAFKEGNPGPCLPLMSPVDVQLDKDDYTMVQPDVLILCDLGKLSEGAKRVFGAPEFLVEVVSPSSYKNDTSLKLRKYLNAGVEEYWIIIPDQEMIMVYEFDSEQKGEDVVKGNIGRIYSFDDEVPVGIWDSKCKIDFKPLREQLKVIP